MVTYILDQVLITESVMNYCLLIKCYIINNYAIIVFKCYILSKQHMKKWPWRLGYLLRQLQNTDVGTNLLR